MIRTKLLGTGAAAAFLLILGDTRATGQQPTIELPVNQSTSYKGEEFLLIGNAVRGAGEPVIAINPKNPNNIIVGAMANSNYVEGEPIGTGQQRVSVEARVKYRNTPGSSISVYAVSHDRGRTWQFIDDPFRDAFKMNGTADAFVGAGVDGRLFMGAMNFFPMNASPQMLELEKEGAGFPGLLFGAIDIAWSNDEGKTWGAPVHVMGQASHPMEYGPGVKPVFRGKTPYDRPYLVTDLSTGTIYVPGHGSGGEPPHGETFIRASKDEGQTWGPIYTFDSPDYPGGGGSRPAAAHGVLAGAYIASSVPPDVGAKCPCLVFAASRDEGKTFERHVVQAALPAQGGPGGGGGGTGLAADPSHPGRFAIMRTTGGNAEIQVYVTEDYGKTWKGPVKAGGTPGATITKPDIGYSPRGDLAIMWLAVNPDQTYACWSTVSHDGGSEFSRSLQVNRAPSPPRSAIKDRGNNWDGDDLSSLAVDSDYVHIVWADGRAGFLGAWYARVPLAGY